MSATPTSSAQVHAPVLFRNRSRPVQILLGGIVPAAIGALAGVMVSVSAGAYWAVAALAAIGSVVSGFEHQDGWGGADRGLVAGAIYGAALLIAHLIVGGHEKVSLGKPAVLLAVVTAIVGMLLCAAGGRFARLRRERSSKPAGTGTS